MTKTNNITTNTRRGSVLDSMRLEPYEYPRDMPIDFTTLSKNESIELFNCIDILMSCKQGGYGELEHSKIEEIKEHKNHLLAKARDLTIKKHLDKRGNR